MNPVPTPESKPCVKCGKPTIGRFRKAKSKEDLAKAEIVALCPECLKAFEKTIK